MYACVLPEMQTVFPDIAGKRWNMEIEELRLHNYLHFSVVTEQSQPSSAPLRYLGPKDYSNVQQWQVHSCKKIVSSPPLIISVLFLNVLPVTLHWAVLLFLLWQ